MLIELAPDTNVRDVIERDRRFALIRIPLGQLDCPDNDAILGSFMHILKGNAVITNLPSDAYARRMGYDASTDEFLLQIGSLEFGPVPLGGVIPRVALLMTRMERK